MGPEVVTENQRLRKENERLRKQMDHVGYVLIDMMDKLKTMERDCRELLGEKDGNG